MIWTKSGANFHTTAAVLEFILEPADWSIWNQSKCYAIGNNKNG